MREIGDELTLALGNSCEMQREIETEDAVDHQPQQKEQNAAANDADVQAQRALALSARWEAKE